MGDKGQFAVNEGSAEPDQNITQTESQNIAEKTDKGLVKSQLYDWTEETYTSSEEESGRVESFGKAQEMTLILENSNREGDAEPDQNVTQTKSTNITEKKDKGLVKAQLIDLTEETESSSEEESGRGEESLGKAQEMTLIAKNKNRAEEIGKSKERELRPKTEEMDKFKERKSSTKRTSLCKAKDAVLPGS